MLITTKAIHIKINDNKLKVYEKSTKPIYLNINNSLPSETFSHKKSIFKHETSKNNPKPHTHVKAHTLVIFKLVASL